MLLTHQEVFDEIITGTDETWYSSSEFNQAIGAADIMRIFAVATDVSGGPTLNVYFDVSADNDHWVESDTPKLTSNLSTDPVDSVEVKPDVDAMASFSRLRIQLAGGGTPQCRLQLYVTGRSS